MMFNRRLQILKSKLQYSYRNGRDFNFFVLFLYYIFDNLRLIGYSVNFYIIHFKNLLRLLKIRNTYKGYDGFVFAGGPSLGLLDQEKVRSLHQHKQFKIIALNSYISGEMASTLIPDFYCLSDSAYFKNDIVPLQRKKELSDDLNKLALMQILTFVPIVYLKKARKLGLNCVGYNDMEYRWGNRNISLLLPRCYMSMTAYKTIAAAIFLGFGKNYICGIDNDYFTKARVDKENQLYFYDNHFQKQFGSGKRKSFKKIGNFLRDMSYLFTDLDYFPPNSIINLNYSGYIDSFSKKHDLDIYKKGLD